MIQFFSQQLSSSLEALDDRGSSSFRRGICPVSSDGRLVVCGFLGGKDSTAKIADDAKSLPRVSPTELVSFVKARHGNGVQYTVWNLSGERYPCRELGDQVIEYSLGVHPAPTVSLLIQLVEDIVSWLDNPRHVAIMHDLSGRRSAVVSACCLFRLLRDGLAGEKADPTVDTDKVLQIVRSTLGSPGHQLVPSQERYIEYYARFHDQEIQLKRPLKLTRVIVNGIPDFVNSGEEEPGGVKPIRCRPFAKLIVGRSTIAGTYPPAQEFSPDDMCFSLRPVSPYPTSEEAQQANPAGVAINGDVLLRCYHLSDQGTSVPMFAVAFHTAFVSDGVLRVTSNQVDGARENGRFPRNFFVDLIFDTAEPLREEPSEPADPSVPKMSKAFQRAASKDTAHTILDEEEEEEIMKRDQLHRQETFETQLSESGSILEAQGIQNKLNDLNDPSIYNSLERKLEEYTLSMDSQAQTSVVDLGSTLQDLDAALEAVDDDFDIDAFASSLDIDLSSPPRSPRKKN